MKWLLDHSVSDSVGVVLEIEEPSFDVVLNNLEYPNCFVKVLWQSVSDPALNPIWHWGEELEVVKKTEKSS